MMEEKRGANLEISNTDLFQAFPKESPFELYISLLVKKRFKNFFPPHLTCFDSDQEWCPFIF